MSFYGKEPVRTKITIKNIPIEQVMNFNYLELNVGNDRTKDINKKINLFQHICGTIRRALGRKVRKETLLKFYKDLAVPMLLYGSECWTLNKELIRRLEVAEMKFLRFVAGYTLMDKKKNEDIRRELKIFNLTMKIEEYRRNWHEHICRMGPERIAHRVLNYKPRGRRSQGRPVGRWIQQL